MDESWRVQIGMGIPNYTATRPRRCSMEENHHHHSSIMGPTRHSTATLDADDFSDVFGGPPRRFLSKKFSGGGGGGGDQFNFYEEVFRLPDFGAPAKVGRSLNAFRIPARNVGFYGDVFGTPPAAVSEASSMVDGGSYGGGSGWRSTPNSSEELSPIRHGDDVSFSSYASKLRPLNVPSRWDPPAKMPEKRVQMPLFMDYQSAESDNFNKTSCYGYTTQHVSSPETQPKSHHSVKVSVEDLELNYSPSTPASSVCQEPVEMKVGLDEHCRRFQQEDVESESDDEIMSSYVIEITSNHHREGSAEELSIDEAIAWAKEKYQSSSSDRQQEKEERPNVYEFFDRQNWMMTEEEKEQAEAKNERDMLDEDIRLWSSNKENNIRSLLSTLHHVLWSNSGWYPVPLTSLIESSQVKKAYQKAQLCLHPDKLQQRGATAPQKYVSEKAFAILQDAWAQFVNQDVY